VELPRSTLAVLALATLGSCQAVPGTEGTAGSPAPVGPQQQVSLYLGQRSFAEDSFWIPNEDQVVGAIEYSREDRADIVGWEIGLAGSSDESSDGAGNPWTGGTGELYGGLRKSWGDGAFRPYVGAGLSYIEAEWELYGQTDDDNSLAGYLHGGVQWLLGRSFALGLDIRTLFGSSLSLGQHTVGFDIPGDADYVQVALSFGWRF